MDDETNPMLSSAETQPDEVKWQVALFALMPLVLGAMVQPVGRVFGAPASERFWMRVSPVVYAADVVDFFLRVFGRFLWDSSGSEFGSEWEWRARVESAIEEELGDRFHYSWATILIKYLPSAVRMARISLVTHTSLMLWYRATKSSFSLLPLGIILLALAILVPALVHGGLETCLSPNLSMAIFPACAVGLGQALVWTQRAGDDGTIARYIMHYVAILYVIVFCAPLLGVAVSLGLGNLLVGAAFLVEALAAACGLMRNRGVRKEEVEMHLFVWELVVYVLSFAYFLMAKGR